jgi:hypothetical protein
VTHGPLEDIQLSDYTAWRNFCIWALWYYGSASVEAIFIRKNTLINETDYYYRKGSVTLIKER